MNVAAMFPGECFEYLLEKVLMKCNQSEKSCTGQFQSVQIRIHFDCFRSHFWIFLNQFDNLWVTFVWLGNMLSMVTYAKVVSYLTDLEMLSKSRIKIPRNEFIFAAPSGSVKCFWLISMMIISHSLCSTSKHLLSIGFFVSI